jgi:hypothetical protein
VGSWEPSLSIADLNLDLILAVTAAVYTSALDLPVPISAASVSRTFAPTAMTVAIACT